MDVISLIPESAPFSAEQRAWLNGFFAGWIGLQGSAPSSAPDASTPSPASAPVAIAEPEPWHDPSLPLDERLRMAEGQPSSSRLMAAMAQLDCGSCGYVCRTYAEAIAQGNESSLGLCTPGGTETARALKRIVKEDRPAPNGTASKGAAVGAAVSGETYSRQNPFTASLLRTEVLNRPGSEKETRHVEIDLRGGPAYRVGDSLGVYPENCPELVAELVAALGASDDDPVTAADGQVLPLREALTSRQCLNEITEDLLARLAGSAADGADAEELRALLDDDAPILGLDVLDLLRRFPSARPAPADFVATLGRLQPRLYSISSSPKQHAGQVHLTVRRVSYEHQDRMRKGVASTMLADRVAPGAPLRVFIQKSHGFTLPDDPATPIIMVGPGTGIAPFRAFLHERDALGATGRSWLFYGDQRGAFDFLYEDELADFLRRGVLTRLDTAFSRDQERKIYVQHRILEHGAELFRWLEAGAHLYVCGDAKHMAADVDRALRALIRDHGTLSDEAAAAYVASLHASGRYSRDVY